MSAFGAIELAFTVTMLPSAGIPVLTPDAFLAQFASAITGVIYGGS
ncbi:MAG: hypothetical protein M3286_03650 [Thermoproteota archaeon]|nr:hypothetical protein [Thermoproteota archaeon]